jgi:DNA invertase Pin-like site-specific DNA recombinase
MKRCAIYIRVSTEEQRINGLSVETQRSVLTEYAQGNDFDIIDYYVDAGLTARKRLSHRKELQRLLIDVENGLIDIIIFTKLDRWFRNISDYYKVQEVLDKYKVNWKTIYEDYDTSTANGRLHINIMLSIAQDEADRTSERIKVVFENKRSRGETPAWKAPLGYKIEKSILSIDDTSKQIALDIFEYYDLHHSVMGCARMARDKHNYKIYDYSIRRMFENKTYIGEFRGIKNFCEPLISEELFYRIGQYVEVREFKNQLIAGRVYLFTSLVFCKECKHTMTSCFTRQNNKSGPVEYHYYRCKEAIISGCPHTRRINEEYLESYLLDNIKQQISGKIQSIKSIQKDSSKKVDVSQINKKIDKLKDLYLDDLIDKDRYKMEYNSLVSQLQATPVYKQPTVEKYKEFINNDIVEYYEKMSPNGKKAFWLGLINKIVVDKDNNVEFFLRD